MRDLHLELLFNVGIYLTCDYKIIVVILSLDGLVNFDMNEKQIIFLLNIQGYLFGPELLKSILYYAMKSVEPRLRNFFLLICI